MGTMPGPLYITDPTTGEQYINPNGPAGNALYGPDTQKVGGGGGSAGSAYAPGTGVSASQGQALQRLGYKISGDAVNGFFVVSAPNALASPGYGSATAGASTSATDTSASGGTTGQTSGQTTRSLPPEAQAALDALVQRLGSATPGFTPQEQAAIQIGPAAARNIIAQAQQPIAGTADKARDTLLGAAAARGGYAPGLNATIEEVQRTEGQQAGQAVEQARTDVEAANRANALAAAQARIGQENTITGQLGNVLTSYPAGTTATTGNSSSTNSQDSTTKNNTTDTSATGPSNTANLVPGGVAPGLNGTIPRGGSGVGAKITKAPNALATQPTALSRFLGYGGY